MFDSVWPTSTLERCRFPGCWPTRCRGAFGGRALELLRSSQSSQCCSLNLESAVEKSERATAPVRSVQSDAVCGFFFCHCQKLSFFNVINPRGEVGQTGRIQTCCLLIPKPNPWVSGGQPRTAPHPPPLRPPPTRRRTNPPLRKCSALLLQTEASVGVVVSATNSRSHSHQHFNRRKFVYPEETRIQTKGK